MKDDFSRNNERIAKLLPILGVQNYDLTQTHLIKNDEK
jgi:hypothetical protein